MATVSPRPPRAFELRPFRAIRYVDAIDRNLAAVLAPPYDVIDDDQRVELESRDPHNVVRLILPRDAAGDSPPWSPVRRAHQARSHRQARGRMPRCRPPAGWDC